MAFVCSCVFCGPKVFVVFCCVFGRVANVLNGLLFWRAWGQVRWPDGPPHLTLNLPCFYFSIVLFSLVKFGCCLFCFWFGWFFFSIHLFLFLLLFLLLFWLFRLLLFALLAFVCVLFFVFLVVSLVLLSDYEQNTVCSAILVFLCNVGSKVLFQFCFSCCFSVCCLLPFRMKLELFMCVYCLSLLQNARLDWLLVWFLLSGSFSFVFLFIIPNNKKRTRQNTKKKQWKCRENNQILCSVSAVVFWKPFKCGFSNINNINDQQLSKSWVNIWSKLRQYLPQACRTT